MNKKNRFWFFALEAICIILIANNSCKKEEEKKAPILITTETTSITTTTATSGGMVTSDGEAAITARGVCWSTNVNPTVALGTKTTDGTGTGAFTSSITGLTKATTYYLRAYATNSNGTAYGNEKSFTTNGTLMDIDGNVYNTLTIGTQMWMKENLKTTKFRNNDPIPNITDNTSWTTQTSGAYCWYNNDITNKATYGALYNWYTVVDSRNLCPTGWHIPTNAEWATLETYLGGSSVAGGKLKSTTVWDFPNSGATNSSGFTAIPSSGRDYVFGSFGQMKVYGYWWSASGYDATNVWYLTLEFSNSGSVRYYCDKRPGSSVRCLKD